MIIPVKLKPFDQWPGECSACRTTGFETLITERQTEIYSGMWIEIDTARPSTGNSRAWKVTLETAEYLTRILFPETVVPLDKVDRLVFCEHMIQPNSIFIGTLLACLHRVGLLKQFPKNKPLPRHEDPLVGALFLAIRTCGHCDIQNVYWRGEVLERIPGADAYVVQPYLFGPQFIRSEFVCRVQGHEMSGWRFYQSIPALLYAHQEIDRQSAVQHTHEQIN